MRLGPVWLVAFIGVLVAGSFGAKLSSVRVSPTPEGTYVYEADFTFGLQGWRSYENGTSPLGRPYRGLQWRPTGGDGGGHVLSAGPWWVDTNHAAPEGAGTLHLVAFAYVKDMPGARVGRDTILDFRDAVVTARVKGEGVDLRGSSLVFWIQGWSEKAGRWVNYALTSTPLDAALASGEWTTVELRLPDEQAQWTCLGASAKRQSYYGCAPLDEVLPKMHHDFGFILFPVQVPAADGAAPDPALLPTGRIAIDRVRIEYRRP